MASPTETCNAREEVGRREEFVSGEVGERVEVCSLNHLFIHRFDARGGTKVRAIKQARVRYVVWGMQVKYEADCIVTVHQPTLSDAKRQDKWRYAWNTTKTIHCRLLNTTSPQTVRRMKRGRRVS